MRAVRYRAPGSIPRLRPQRAPAPLDVTDQLLLIEPGELSASTITTSAGVADWVTMAAASVSGAVPRRRASISSRSARLPGVIEPMLSARPRSRAPPRVAHSSTWRGSSAIESSLMPLARLISTRMIEKKSALPASAVLSTDRLSATPAWCSRSTGGRP